MKSIEDRMFADSTRRLRKWTIVGLVILGGVGALVALWPKPPFVIGVVNHASVAFRTLEGFKFGMRQQGYVAGRDVVYLYDGPTGRVDAVEQQARDHLQSGADMFLAFSTPSALAAKKVAAQSRTPVLFAPASNPVGSGLVGSLDQPGGYVSGVMPSPQENRRLEWFLRIAPQAHTVLYPYNPGDKSPTAMLKIVRAAALTLRIKIVPAKTPNVEALRLALRNISPEITGIFVSPDAMVASHMDMIIAEADLKNLPVSVPHYGGVLKGALTSYGLSLYDVGIQVSKMAGHIIHGEKPADMPVQKASFKLMINIRNARQLGLIIPDDILRQALLVGG